MATINLGRIKPVFRGAYAGGTAYVVDDIVTHGNETFICIQAGTGNATSNASYWTKLAAKGTDGTDVGTTLTTQGDILYRDGSGLQRLAAGTSGQVLQTGGSGANPSWTAISSDFVKLSTQTVTSGVAKVTFKGFANSIYGSYELQCSDVQKTGTGDQRLNFRWHINNSDISTSGYRGTFHGHHFNSSNSNNENYGGNWQDDHIQLSNWNMPDTRNSGEQIRHLTLNIGYLNDSSYNPVFQFSQINPHPGATYTNHDVGGGYHVGSETRISFGTNDGFSLIPNGDQIGKGIFTLYGRKK